MEEKDKKQFGKELMTLAVPLALQNMLRDLVLCRTAGAAGLLRFSLAGHGCIYGHAPR